MQDSIDENLLTLIGIVVAIIGVVIPVYKYLFDRKLQLQDARFRIYHELIKSLVEPELQKENVIDEHTGLVCNVYGKMLDRQVATIFELRNFPEYFEVTKRILEGLKAKWEEEHVHLSITHEIQYTLSYITIYQRCIYKILRWTVVLSPLANRLINSKIKELKY